MGELDPAGSADEVRIERMTSHEVAAAVARGRRTAILPLGAVEQHGPHLPLSTDADHADALAVRVARALGNALVLPTIRVGYSPITSVSREPCRCVRRPWKPSARITVRTWPIRASTPWSCSPGTSATTR